MSETWTIGRLLQWTTDYLKQHGADTPRLDAEVLLAHCAGASGSSFIPRSTSRRATICGPSFAHWSKSGPRASRWRISSAIASSTRWSFRVTPDVLIPRPETELLVVRLLDIAKERGPSESLAIADVGTGSGIIAVVAAKWLPSVRVTAIERSRESNRCR